MSVENATITKTPRGSEKMKPSQFLFLFLFVCREKLKREMEKMKPFSKNNLFCISRETKGKRIIMGFNNRIIKARYTSAAKCLAYGRNASKACDKHTQT